MPLDVRNGKQRLIPSVRKPFCEVYAHEKRAQKSCSVSHRNCVDIVFRHLCLFKSLFDHVFDCESVISARDFRHDSAETTVYFDLRCHDVRHDFSSVAHDCASGFVATRLDGKHG